MQLYLIRHAEAAPLATSGVNSDADRPLTAHGHAQSLALSTALQRQGVVIDLLLTSPYLRARQTAQGLLDGWPDPKPRIEECEELASGGKVGKLARLLRKEKLASAALVGHMPDLAEHAAWLLGSRKVRLDFDKAGVAYIDCSDLPDKGAGCLVWLLAPSWFMG